MDGLTPKQEEYINDQLATGAYKSSGELLDEALLLHQKRTEAIEALRVEIEKGAQSGLSNKTIDDIIEEKKKEYGL